MENNEKRINKSNLISKGELIDYKKYILQLDEDFYTLLIELYNNVLCFKLNSHKLSLNQYTKECTYEDILNIISLQKTDYEDLKKVFIIFDKAIIDKKVNLSENKNKKMMILKLKRISSDNKEFEYDIELNECKIPEEEIIKTLSEEIYLLRKDKEERKKMINILMEKNKQNEKDIKDLENTLKKYEGLENSIISKVDEKIENFKTYNMNQQSLSNQMMNPPMWGIPPPMQNVGMGMMNNMNMNMMPNQKKEIMIFLEDDRKNRRISIVCSPTATIEYIRSRYFSKIFKKDEDEIFIFNAQKLERDKTIADYGIENGSKIIAISNVLIG